MAPRIIKLTFALLVVLLVISCMQQPQNNDGDVVQGIKLDSNNTIIRIKNRLFSIPSPVQIVLFIKEQGVRYDPTLPNPTNQVSRYTGSTSQALNLGIYGAGLAYVNLFEQYQEATKYFATVKSLSEQLGIHTGKENSVMEQFEANQTNKDSVMSIVSEVYKDLDTYLMENDRNDVSLLILTGGWVEGMYYLTQHADTAKTEIINRIGEQKHALYNILELLRPYHGQRSTFYDGIYSDFVELAYLFDGVSIKYHFQQPVNFPEKHLTKIKGETTTEITTYQFRNIQKQIASIRTKIIDR